MAIQFPGSSSEGYVDTGYEITTAAQQQKGTILMDIWQDAATNTRTLLRQGTVTTNRHRLGTDSGIGFEWYKDRSTTDMRISAPLANFAAHALGKWITLIVGWDTGQADSAQYMAVGDQDTLCAEPSSYAARTAGVGTVQDAGGSNVRIGHDPAIGIRSWNGRIGRVWYYESLIPLAEMLAYQFEGIPRPGASFAYDLWSQSWLYDLSGNGRHGSMGGSGTSDAEHGPIGCIGYRRRGRLYLPEPTAAGQIVSLNQVSETDLAQAFGRLKTLLVGQVSETDLAQALTAVKARLIGQVSELDEAGAFAALKVLALAQASELDVAQALTALKLLAMGQATEADIAQAMTPVKARGLGQVTETDEAQALTSHKTRPLAQVTEVDEAMPMTRAGDAIGQVTETDTAGVLTPLKTRELGAVSEVDAAQAMTAAKSQAAGQAAELDVAQPLAHLKQKAITQAAELDQAGVLTPTRILAIGQPSETDLAQAFAVEKRRALGMAFEVDEALPFTPIGGAQAVIPVVTLSLPLRDSVTLAATIHPPALTLSLPLHPET